MPERSTRKSFSRRAWKKLIRNKGAAGGLIVILLAVFAGIFAYLIVPDNTPDANNMVLEIGGKPPGFRIGMLALPGRQPVKEEGFFEKLLHGRPGSYTWLPVTGYRFTDDSLIVQHYVDEETTERESFFLPAIATIPRGSLSLAAWQEQIAKRQLSRRTFWLGTDRYGRDILSRIIIGVRVSLSVGLIAVIISLSIGIFLGAIAGYFRGKTDDAVMWLINVIWSIPTLLLVFALTIALGKGFWQIFIAVGLTMWVSVARIIRGQVISLRETEFIEATRALGFSHARTIVRHILPNILGPVLVIAANNFATAIVIEAGLSFLGIGVQPPMPSWGLMLKENYGFIITHDPFLAIIPGVAIMIMVLAFNLVGNGLRDAMDVKGGEG